MKATEANLLKFLKKSPQFVIPIYQRNYSWTEVQCRQLWADLLRAGRDERITAHFIGAIVYVERGLGNVVQQEAMLVIDGQQRLTTSTLLIAALAKHFKSKNITELLEAFSDKKLRNYYLFNPDEEGERHFKLILSETDKETLLAILQNNPMPDDASSRINKNYELFQNLILQYQDELEAICQGLAKLVIVDVSLDRSQDNPQLIFESMNSTGLELSQADLIRNYILMGLEPKLQTDLYKTYWRPMEKAFGQANYGKRFDEFMRHYLTAKTGEIPKVHEVYLTFKKFASLVKGDLRHLVADIHSYANYYCAMALDAEKNVSLKQAFHDLCELKVDVAYPFLLDVYHDYKNDRINADELLQIVRLVESYVFRRAICDIPTNSMNFMFAGLSKSLKKDRYLESVCAAFLMLPSYRRFPSDEEFSQNIKVKNIYKFRSRSYWLRRLENHGRKERVIIEDYTIEHILPQNQNLSKRWQDDLGEDWRRVQDTWLHTLGNLTLTGYNSEYSDNSFEYKRDNVRDKDGNLIGFACSPLKLNQGLGQVAIWNESEINKRAARLAAEALKVWCSPQLESDVLDIYCSVIEKTVQTYAIQDHFYLTCGAIRDLFNALRRDILALDPCVNEEFLKLYVAYKAEINFVDVVPQANRLCLSLNMRFDEINDPKGICLDVTELSRWGNGHVEVGLSTLNEIPYVMGLIRQSFDHQMGALQNP